MSYDLETLERHAWARNDQAALALIDAAELAAEEDTASRVYEAEEAARTAGHEEGTEEGKTEAYGVAAHLAVRHGRAVDYAIGELQFLRAALVAASVRTDGLDAALFALSTVSEEIDDYDDALERAEAAPNEDAEYERAWHQAHSVAAYHKPRRARKAA